MTDGSYTLLKNRSGYYSDAPIHSPDEDAFGRDKFAERMATVIDHMANQSKSSVAALVGPWGSGKSSVFNLLSARLERRDNAWHVRRFDPWLFSDVDSLLTSYFSELLAVMPKGDKGKAVRDQIGKYAKKVAPLGKLTAALGFDSESIIKVFGELLSGGQSIHEQRRGLELELAKLDFRVVMIMDDMDRLQPDELLVVLKVIRLIGDFPNVHYLLAYDERTLLDVLMGTPIGNGIEERAAQYLDKIVQVRFDLPPLTESQEELLFDEGVLGAFQSVGAVVDEEEFRRLGAFFESQMKDTLRVPRSMNKYLGQLAAFLDDDVVQELNAVDYAILTYIRTFHGPLYSRMPYWKAELTGHRAARFGKRDDVEESRQEWRDRLQATSLSDRDPASAISMLAHLFPRLAALRSGYSSGGVDSSRISLNRNLAASEYFDRYFQFQVPDDDVSDALVSGALDALCGISSNPSKIDAASAVLDAEPVRILSKIRSLLQGRSYEHPEGLLRLLESRYSTFDEYGARRHRSARELTRHICYELLSQAPEEFRLRELEYGSDNYELDFGLDMAFMLDRNDVGSPAQSLTFVSKLADRVRVHFDTEFSSLAEVSYDKFGLFKSWGYLVAKGVAREYAQTRISAGEWSLQDYLVRISGTRTLIGVDNPKPYLGSIDAEYIDHFIGARFAIEKLGDDLNREVDANLDRWIAYPTDAQRLNSVVLVLQEIARTMARIEVDAEDSADREVPKD